MVVRTDHFYPSCGEGQIHWCQWLPEGTPKGVVQIVHGIAEYVERYDAFARYLNGLGLVVVAEDHMGHGQSVGTGGTLGYFAGGWFAAVEDTHSLMKQTMASFPGIPYLLFGHSMGSFMTRTILEKYPDSGISGAVICGTGWQPRALLPGVIRVVEEVCRRKGERNPSEKLQNLVFGSYNRRVEHPRTDYDWLTRDAKIVDDYVAHPLCGFTASAGLLRDMMRGIAYIEQPENLNRMKKDLPVLLIAGGDDPVGNYGAGVRRTVSEFQKHGMTDVSCRIYPLCRHEILNEINREEIFGDVGGWMQRFLVAEN